MIRYVADKNQFFINAPPQFIGPVMRLPMRRFMKKAGVWQVPATRLNCQVMLDTLKSDKWEWQPEALEAAHRATSGTQELRAWPAWYRHAGPEPYEHQKRAMQLAYARDAFFLSMEQGTAKTKVAIDVGCAHYLHQRVQYVVIVCPMSVCRTWEDELRTHCPLPFVVHRADSKFKGVSNIRDGEICFIIAGVESFSQGRAGAAFMAWAPYHKFMMVIDESHSIKTHSTVRTQILQQIGRQAKVRLCLTGTPVTKSLIDLYSQYEFLDPNIIGIGDFYAFRNRYAIMGGFKKKNIIGYDNVEEFMGFIQPYTFAITKKECLDLPEKIYTRRYIELSKAHRDQYAALKKNALEPFELKNVLVKMLRLRQLLGGFLPNEDGVPVARIPAKDNTRLQALITELEVLQGPVIIFCEWVPELRLITDVLPEGKAAVFTSDLDADQRQALIHGFQNGVYRYFVSTTQLAHVGLTLTAAETVIYYSHSNSYVIRTQSEDRAHRAGLRHPVTYIDFVANKTVDETLVAAHEVKLDLATYVAQQMQAGKEIMV
jgi:superfamily II DNA or RNA helicase